MSKADDIHITTDTLDAIICHKCGKHLSLAGLAPFSEIMCSGCKAKQTVPLKFDNFFLLGELGKGGMGVVYKALDQTLGRYVALKVMRKEFGEDAAAVEGFLREARSAAALNHPNIVQIYSCGQHNGQPYLVMEMVAGGRLDKMMKEGGAVDEEKTMEMAIGVAQGLRAAHHIGLVHGDIKPENILFGVDGTAKVVDFGLARFVASQQAAGEVWGTPFYIAPEKIRREPEDHRSDIYSFGATIFHALCGEPPFDAETANEVVLARLGAPARGVREVRPELHPETEHVIARMLEESTSSRYPTYKSLLPDLRAAWNASKDGPYHFDQEPKKKSGGLLALVGLLVVAVVVGAFIMFSGKKEPEPEKEEQKYIIIGNTKVPITTGRQAASEADSSGSENGQGAEAATTEMPEQVGFDEKQEEAMAAAVLLVAQGDVLGAETALESLAQNVKGANRAWVYLHLGTVYRLQGHPRKASAALKEATQAIETKKGPEAFSAAVAKLLARSSLENLKNWLVEERTRKGPQWQQDNALFIMGLNSLERGEADAAVKLFTRFAEAKPDDTGTWLYALQPLARELAATAAEWVALNEKMELVEKVDKVESVNAALVSFTQKAPAVFAYRLKSMNAEAAKVLKKVQAEREVVVAKKMAENKVQVQVELDELDTLHEKLMPAFAAKKFKEAEANWNKSAPKLSTVEAAAWKEVLAECYTRLEDAKQFLIKSINAAPPGAMGQRELGGAILSADDAGLTVSLGGAGEVKKTWKQVNAKLFIGLVQYYLANAPPANKEHALHLSALAIYCFEGGALDRAKAFARQTKNMDGAAAQLLAQRAPGVLDI